MANLDPGIHELLTTDPVTLLSGRRFDLAFKLLYLRLCSQLPELAAEVYLSHIKAFSTGRYLEPGNPSKRGASAFLDAFGRIRDSVEATGFDETRSVIPLSTSGVPCNGAHRVAAAIAAGRPVVCVRTSEKDPDYGVDFFRQRGVHEDLLDLAAVEFIRWASNARVALVWPAAADRWQEVRELLGRIIYTRAVHLDRNGARLLLMQVYANQPWLKRHTSSFLGVDHKLFQCFVPGKPLHVIVFQAEHPQEVAKKKAAIRARLDMGKHSIHIGDDRNECLSAARILFNRNGRHFLQHARPERWGRFPDRLEAVRKYMASQGVHAEEVVLDGGMVMNAYGIRDAGDIDYLRLGGPIPEIREHGFESHDNELRHHGCTREALVLDPRLHFWFDGIKFVALDQVQRMKRARDEAKDRFDVAAIEAQLADEGHEVPLVETVYVKYHYGKHWLLNRARGALLRTRLYYPIRGGYRCLKRAFGAVWSLEMKR